MNFRKKAKGSKVLLTLQKSSQIVVVPVQPTKQYSILFLFLCLIFYPQSFPHVLTVALNTGKRFGAWWWRELALEI